MASASDSNGEMSATGPAEGHLCSVIRASLLTENPQVSNGNSTGVLDPPASRTCEPTPLQNKLKVESEQSANSNVLHQDMSLLQSTSTEQDMEHSNSITARDSKRTLLSLTVGGSGLLPPVTIPPVAAPMPGVGGGSKMREIRERAKLRRQLVAQQLGVWCPERLGEALGNTPSGSSERQLQRSGGSGSLRAGRHRRHHGSHHSTPDLVSLYTDSTTFLKGTQSANPHNDYCQHFVDTGQRPQNFIRDVGLADRFEEYPKLRELIKLKDDLIAETASPPSYLKADLHHLPLASLRCEFDVILVEPPLEEYQHTAPGHAAALNGFWDWNQIRELDIAQVAAPRSFIFLWVGSSEGLDEGRRCLRSWGFRRCEDICWIRTNSTNPGHSKNLDHKAVFQRTKEHCLMGIKGTVRRSTDGDFIHANVDIDLIITEEGSSGTLDKPVEIFHIIEHFCLGKRRLHLFGRDPSIRPGWLTVGPDLSSSNFDPSLYASYFSPATGGLLTTGCTDRIEALRPKSPPPKPGGKTRGGYTRGRGRGR